MIIRLSVATGTAEHDGDHNNSKDEEACHSCHDPDENDGNDHPDDAIETRTR